MIAATRWTSLALLLVCTAAMLSKMEFSWAGLLFVPLALWPLMVSAAASFFVKVDRAAGWLLASSLLYALWYGYLFVSAFYLHPDPQAGLVFLFVGIYSLPVMLVLWIVALVKEVRQRQREQFDETTP